MIATLFSRAGVRKRKNARGCVQSSSSSVGTRSNGEVEDHWLECRSRTLYTNTISVSFDFPNILHFYNTLRLLFGDCLENDCEVSWLGLRQETEVDCSLKIDGHQVLKPFNEQFLSIIHLSKSKVWHSPSQNWLYIIAVRKLDFSFRRWITETIGLCLR